MQHRHGHGYAIMHHGHGLSAWTCSIDMDMDMDMEMYHGHGHVAWTRTCSMDVDTLYGLGHAAWCMSMFMLHVHGQVPAAWLKLICVLLVQGHAACPSPCCMFVSMFVLHVMSVHMLYPFP
jgi:hypothetical protein